MALGAELEGAAARALTGVRLAAVRDPAGRAVELSSAYSHAGPDPESGAIYLGLSFSVADPGTGAIQPGQYHATLSGVTQAVPGPWEVSWDLP